MPEKRRIPSWEETFLQVALVMSKRTHCFKYEVGAVLVRGNKIVATGYNGPASGDVHCDEVGCAKEVSGVEKKQSGLCRGSHTEINAITNAARLGVSIEECHMYVNYRPCKSCAKQIGNAGIKRVVYMQDYDGDLDVPAYLGQLGVKLEKYDIEKGHFVLMNLTPKKEKTDG
uniref:dCMP deaminase family protein n=1 Tax=candidate division CPR3 bacterium TaxID=2268181 RepID=A0A7C4R5W6_UNCC3